MVFSVNFDYNTNTIEWHNANEYEFKLGAVEKKMSFDLSGIPDFVKDMDIDILVPVDDGEDFIFRYSTGVLFTKSDRPEALAQFLSGCSFGDILPGIKDFFYATFKKVYKTGEKETITACMYENGDLKDYFELRVSLYNDEIYIVPKEETEKYLLQRSIDLAFDDSPLIKTIMQDDKVVKVNKTHERLLGQSLEDMKDLTLEDYNKNEIISNDTGLVLNLEQIYRLILNKEYDSIVYRMILSTEDLGEQYFETLGRRIYFDGRPAVEFTVYNIASDIKTTELNMENIELLQEYTKSTFIFYDLKTNLSKWGHGLERLLERPIPADSDLKEIFKSLISPEYHEMLVDIESTLSIDNNTVETEYVIVTPKGNSKHIHIILKGLVEDNEITTLFYVLKDVTDEFNKNKELEMLNTAMLDVQTAANITVHYIDNEGKHYWSPQSYDIIEREPRDTDSDTNIFAELTIEGGGDMIESEMSNLEPNEFMGDKMVTIKTENGKTKYIRVNGRRLYNENGEFVQWNEYGQDITEEYIRNQQLLTLNATVEDVQYAAAISVQYMDAEGKYHWTDETYNIIDREPREGDEDTHIIGDLMTEEDASAFAKVIEDLEPGEFYNEDRIWTITTESGKVKYLKGSARKIYDENGKFIRRSEFAQDVTEEYIKTNDLYILNESFKDVQKATLLSINFIDANGKYHWSSDIYQMIEREPRDGDEDYDIVLELTDDETRSEINKLVEELPLGEFLPENIISIITETGKMKFLKLGARNVADDKGNFLRFIGYTQDVTNQINYENELIQADKDKTLLVQEVHHRVKNNLQLISSFINLEKKFHRDDPERIINVTEDRISSLALIHERIYNEDDMNYIQAAHFLKDFDNNLYLFSSDDDIKFIRDIDDDLTLSIDIITPLTLMINELTTNSFKYAFNEDLGREKTIYKSIKIFEKDDQQYCEFKFADSGKGLPENFDILKTPSLGWKIIVSLVGQLDGEYKLFNDNGLNIEMTFPIKK